MGAAEEMVEAVVVAAVVLVVVGHVTKMVRLEVVAVDQANSNDVIKVQCVAAMIEEMTAADHTKNPFDLMITDFYI